MAQIEPTLCFPDTRKSCFACCPPIRPAEYEHIQFQSSVKRMLQENTACYKPEERDVRPIVGYSCWALGYVDPGCRLVGCLLHPMQNRGVDLRYRVGYGEKCVRETCPEAQIFAHLDHEARLFWLQLADGLDSFAYSSLRKNPLFRLMGWGTELLGRIASEEAGREFGEAALFRSYPFFTTGLLPRAAAYLAAGVVHERGLAPLRDKSFPGRLEEFSSRLAETLKVGFAQNSRGDAVHRLPLNGQFLDFLRLFLGVRYVSEEEARQLKERVDRAVEGFSESLV